jgi:ABC-type antimicrobial peptide transport system permease subunit
MSQALAGLGFVLVYPVIPLVAMFVLAALAGALASIGPARRAADIDVLDAVAYE